MMWLRTGSPAGSSALQLALATVLLGSVLGIATPASDPAGAHGISAQTATDLPPHIRAHDYGSDTLTAEQKAGRDTWYFWTAGNQKFWRRIASVTEGNVDLLLYVDSRLHDRRFESFGVINHPGCRAAKAPDRYGLWFDDCSEAIPAPAVPGQPAGIVGLRRFDNPAFDEAKWDLERYLKDRGSVEPPYLIGMSCGFCHVGFNPIGPPRDVNRPTWANLSPGIGNQYFREGRLFSANMTPADFRWHVASRQPPGTSDTSRFATDHNNNPSAINPILNLAHRPTAPERMRDGSIREVPRILKDGADSVGIAGASLRVYVNIGMCGEYSATLHDPVLGVERSQRPFDIEHARATCEDWRATEARMAATEAFLKSLAPLRLADAREGESYLATDAAVLHRGKLAFAAKCAACHSSKQPPPDAGDRSEWFRNAVLRDDFLEGNFLSDDRRYPVTRIGTNVGRAMATNAARGHIWEQFSSETYKSMAPVGILEGLYNPRDSEKPIDFAAPGGGPGYYRTPSLVSVWATAPYLHNNSVGVFLPDPTVSGRMAAFRDGITKMLWPERRLGVQSIPVTTTESTVRISGTTRTIRVPAGTPIDYIARVDPTRVAQLAASLPVVNLALQLTPDDVLLTKLLERNLAPDFILDRGHTFGADLPDEDKHALIEFLKTF
jgi:cytochrome c5